MPGRSRTCYTANHEQHSIFGRYQCSDSFSRRIRDVLATIFNDKIVQQVYFLETYCRTPHTFLQVAVYARKYKIQPKVVYLRTAKFISLPKQARGCNMIPCPPCVVAPKSQLGQPWDAYTQLHFPERLVESIIGHAFTIFVHNSGYTQLFRGREILWAAALLV